MARKTSDMIMLLGSRGRSRARSGSGRSGLGKRLVGYIDGLLGRRRREERSSRGATVSSWLALVAVLAAFGGGFLLGGGMHKAEAAGKDVGKDALRAKVEGQAPGFVNEAKPPKLAPQGFLVAAYRNLPDADAQRRANDLAKLLQDRKLAKARPFVHESDKVGRAWGVVVYFDGESEQAATRERLLHVGEVSDEYFDYLRNSQNQWPIAVPID